MNRLNNLIRKMGGGTVFIASLFLLGMMVLIVSNIIYRFFGGVIPQTYELVELFGGMTAAMALGYAALTKRHIVINLLLTKLPQRVQTFLGINNSVISVAFWVLVAWGSLSILLKKGLGDVTLNYYIPLFPFRGLWSLGLFFFCLILLVDIINILYKVFKK